MEKQFHNVHASNEGIFSTVSGRKIDIMNPDLGAICGYDIAYHLSHICRFGGMINCFYSVAQHSVMVSHMVSREYALAGLLHDASEAYLGDVIKPLKNVIGKAYTDIEDRFMSVIFRKAGLEMAMLRDVHQADRTALELEHAAFKHDDEHPFCMTAELYGMPTCALPPEGAYTLFRHRLRDLMFGNEYDNFFGEMPY